MELTIEQALQQGVTAHKEGKLQEAERLYRAILQSQPAHPDANHNLGLIAVSANKADSALPLFKTALEANPKIEQFWLSYIDCLMKEKQFYPAKQALVDAKQAGVTEEKLHAFEEQLQSKSTLSSDTPQHESDDQSQSHQAGLSPAIELREVGKYKEAQKWLGNVIERDPNNPEALSLLSQVLLLDKKEEQAENVLLAAESINPELPSVYRNQARLLLKQSKPGEALVKAKLGYEQSPKNIDNLLVLAACLGANQRDAEALPIIEKILEAQPSYAEAYANRALIKLRAKDTVGAIKEAEKAVLLKPHLAQVWWLLSSLYYESNNLTAAIKALRSAHKNDPENIVFMVQLAEFLQQDNKANEAIPILEQATEFAPKDANAWTNLGVALQQEEKIADAKLAYQKALAINPRSAVISSNLGAIAKDDGEWESALQYFEKAIAIKPDFAEGHSNLGNTLKELGRLEEAEASYTKAITLKPDYADAHNNLGNTLQELGNFEEAKESYTQAIALKPDSADAHNNLGNTLQELGKLEEAEVSYTQAIALKPNYADARYNLGITLRELGRLEEAEASYTQAIALKPDFAEAHRNLGLTLQELGRIKEAVSSFQKAFSKRTGIRPVGDDVLAPATDSVLFELTNKCNFHCTFCPSDSQTRDIGSMDFELVKRLYEEAADKKINDIVNLHLMGEPTLHPQLIEILKFGASKNIKTDLVTNGSTLVAKVVPKILDSMYGIITVSHMTPTQETYHFRGEVRLSWDRYISNLRLLVREYLKRLAQGAEIKCEIVIRVMATQNTASNVTVTDTPNEARAILKEWNDFVAEVEQELGMTSFKRKDHNDDDLLQENRHKSISYPLQKGIKLTFWRAFTFANTRVSEDFELETRKETTYCPHPFTDVGVLWNGDVTLCCLDHDGELKVGNINDSSIETVIQSEAARKLRASMLGHQPLHSLCQNCQAKPVRREDAQK
jgi:radical SAM protein with 4Fe4S-binding SPASM domain